MQKVGEITPAVASLLNITPPPNSPIFLGETNIQHMQEKHPAAYAKYGPYISDILSTPDYVGLNPKDNSLEYVKEFVIDNEYVKVAVRIAGSGTYYARSLYCLNARRVNNFIQKGTLKPLP